MREKSSYPEVHPLSLEEDESLKEFIRKNAFLNAVRHDGKAQTGAVLGKVLGERADLRTRVKELSTLISEIIRQVNSLTTNDQIKTVEKEWPETLTKHKPEEEKQLPPLPNVEKYKRIVTRFSPNPDSVLHLGSARAIVLCHDYAKMYQGTFILRFEDTDPRTKRPVLEFFDRIREDLAWLGCPPDTEYTQSDRMPIYYEHSESMIKGGIAYVCTHQPDEFRKLTLMSKACSCRGLPASEHLDRWCHMLEGDYKEGEAVVRVKTDLAHPNPAVRDWPALRVIDIEKHPHPRVGTKYRVWPLYNLSAGVDDHLLGVTHIIRGKEHLTNQVRQEYMYRYFGWSYPETIHYGRLRITGATLSKSKIVQGVKEGLYKGWDDPRLGTFAALRKRGIRPEAIRKMMIDIGPKTQDIQLSWENLYAYNRKILDPITDRYFFVWNPVELTVKGIPREIKTRLHFHPQQPDRGFREYTVTPLGEEKAARFWISKQDAETKQPGDMIRLMELFNIKIEESNGFAVGGFFTSNSHEEAKKMKAQLIHWVLINEDIPCKVIMPDASLAEGIAERACRKLKPETTVQFERFGFVRISGTNDVVTANYGHK